jgi:hypothetical protein
MNDEMWLVATIVFAALVAAAQAAPDENSANFMLPHCKNYISNTVDSAGRYCAGSVEGIAFTAGIFGGACVPEHVTRGQLVRAAVRYIEMQPERMHEAFDNLALEAIIAAWPCPILPGQ